MNKHWFTRINIKGFTLLEVTLFLAISASLVAIAVAGLAPRLRNVRFTSAVRDLEANITSSFGEGAAAQNMRTASNSCDLANVWGITVLVFTTANIATNKMPGANDKCVIVGRVMFFEETKVTTKPIIALREPVCADPKDTIESLLDCHYPNISKIAEESAEHNYSNGLILKSINGQSLFDRGGEQISSGFGYIINPVTSRRYNVQLDRSGIFFETLSGAIRNAPSGDFTPQLTYSTPLCFGLDSRRALFTFTNSSLKPIIKNDTGCL